MIVSTSKKFIFVHNPKAAGTSIRRALQPWNDGKHLVARTKHETINQFTKRTKINLDDYFIFGFVRNPWDRFSSFYHFMKGKPDVYPQIKGVKDLPDFASKLNEKWLKDRYSVKQQRAYFNPKTFVFKYENLSDDLGFIAENIGVEIKLGHANKSANKDYRNYYDDKSKEIIATKYKGDIELYDYTF